MNEHEQNSLSGHDARWRLLVDGMPVSLYRTTPDGQFWDVNLAMVEMLGYPSREELLALNPVDLYVHPEEREHWKTLIAQEGVVRNFEFQIRRYDGAILWLNSSARAVKDEQGRVIYYEGSLEDITERKRMEAEREQLLQAAREHLRRADALRQACAALTSTLNYEEVLKRILEQMSQVVPHDTANIMLIKGEQAQVIQGHGYEHFDPNWSLQCSRWI